MCIFNKLSKQYKSIMELLNYHKKFSALKDPNTKLFLL
jgi:hypothetical protein